MPFRVLRYRPEAERHRPASGCPAVPYSVTSQAGKMNHADFLAESSRHRVPASQPMPTMQKHGARAVPARCVPPTSLALTAVGKVTIRSYRPNNEKTASWAVVVAGAAEVVLLAIVVASGASANGAVTACWSGPTTACRTRSTRPLRRSSSSRREWRWQKSRPACPHSRSCRRHRCSPPSTTVPASLRVSPAPLAVDVARDRQRGRDRRADRRIGEEEDGGRDRVVAALHDDGVARTVVKLEGRRADPSGAAAGPLRDARNSRWRCRR